MSPTSRFGFNSVFSKLFISVVLTLVLFAAGMVTLMNLVHNNSADARWEVLAKQIVSQIDPFVDELDNATTMNELLQARFMLAVIKRSFDVFDESLQAKMGLYDRNGNLLIQTDDSDLPKKLPNDPSFISRLLPAFFSSDLVNAKAISDRGYTLLYEPRNPPKRSELWAVLNIFTGTITLIAVMSIVLWWIAHSMTWRINQMSKRMAQLGEGNFSVRVPAQGTDEIASLARGFNQAAQKIEQLIDANNLLLAHASHELRTPITRIRLQIEMMDMLANEMSAETQAKFRKRAQAVNRDLTGLNDLVESILLVSRLDAGHASQTNERFDFYDLVSQECQHYPEATLYGKHLVIEGQPKLLIHLIRNLLNNALIHGEPPIEVHLYGVVEQEEALYPPKQLLDLIEEAKAKKVTFESQSLFLDDDYIETEDGNLTDSAVTSENIPDNSEALETETATSPLSASLKDTSKKQDKANNKASDNGFTKRLRRPKVEPVIKPNFAVLSVIDQGKGIPLDKREEIFSPFVRLQQQRKGSGLGLSLVAQIVEAHHGRIRTDTYNGRTRFIVLLPVNENVIVEQPGISEV
ncbi:HAMP domain-containing sensor histidine kinase [Psychrobacter sp.]|uniref:sensor histidine kinase n=1 Tax=Psychrobacter sp. TaxID=56811 RepID=UPI0025E4D596|nr:HAMP domain-containing sensor histidine kinase [Psychrobacter sp.]